MGQGTSGLPGGKSEKSNDSTLEFEPGHKIFAQTERNKRFKGIKQIVFKGLFTQSSFLRSNSLLTYGMYSVIDKAVLHWL